MGDIRPFPTTTTTTGNPHETFIGVGVSAIDPQRIALTLYGEIYLLDQDTANTLASLLASLIEHREWQEKQKARQAADF